MLRTALLVTLLLLSTGSATTQQHSTPPQSQIQNGQHQRITKTEVAGQRHELATLKGASLFTSPSFSPARPVPLLIHFHGAPWLIETHVARHLPKAALITVQLGAGSSVYRRPFENPGLFRELMNEAAHKLSLKRGWSSITLTGFSAGYGGVREILRRPEYFALVDNVLLLDGLHASYADERNPQGAQELNQRPRKILASDIDIFVSFARAARARGKAGSDSKWHGRLAGDHAQAAPATTRLPQYRRQTRQRRETGAGRKTFVVTHSEIFPGTYASTTECADYLLAALSLKRRPTLDRHSNPARGPMGMQQLSTVDAGGFRVRGYAGSTAPDHIDFLHAIPAWFSLLQIL